MRTYSSTRPTEEIKLEIDSKNEYCDVLFFVNVEEIERESKTILKYVMLDKSGNMIEDNISIQKARNLSNSEVVKQNEYIVKPIYTYTKETVFGYDYYRFKNVKYREGLLDTINEHKNEWIVKAKLSEMKNESNTNSDVIDIGDLKKRVEALEDLIQDIILNLIPLDSAL